MFTPINPSGLVSPTPPTGDNSDRIATTAFVQQNAITGPPGTVFPANGNPYTVQRSDYLKSFIAFASTGPGTWTLNLNPATMGAGFFVTLLVSNDSVQLNAASGFIINPNFGNSSSVTIDHNAFNGQFFYFGTDGANIFLSGGQVPVAPFIKTNYQFFSTNNTYLPSAGLIYATFEAKGGGGGGGAVFGSTSNALGGGGGGAGVYARSTFVSSAIGASQAITIGGGGSNGSSATPTGGAGGTTTVGALMSAPGGSGGQFNNGSSAIGIYGTGGAGGTAQLFWQGADGFPGDTFLAVGGTVPFAKGGAGAGGVLGYGGSPGIAAAGVNGNFGGGGGGGSIIVNNGWIYGGSGGSGWVLVTEFLLT